MHCAMSALKLARVTAVDDSSRPFVGSEVYLVASWKTGRRIHEK